MADEKPKTFKERLNDFLSKNSYKGCGVFQNETELEKEEAFVSSYNDGLEEGYNAGFKDGLEYFYDKFHENFGKKSYSEIEVYEVLDIISDTLDDLETEVSEC